MSTDGTALNEGEITCCHTTTSQNIFFKVPIGKNRTQVAAYTIPAGTTGLLDKIYCSIEKGSTLQSADIDVFTRSDGGVFESRRPTGVSTNYSIVEPIFGGLVLTEKTDVVIRIESVSANNVDITGGFDIILIEN